MRKSSRREFTEIVVNPSDLNNLQPLARFLIVIFRQFEDELIESLRKKGHKSLSPSDFNVLRFISPVGTTAVEIAHLAGVSKQAIGKLVTKLEKADLVKREPSAIDERAKLVVFTAKGRRLIQDSIGIIAKIEQRYSDILGNGQLDKLKTRLYQLIKT